MPTFTYRIDRIDPPGPPILDPSDEFYEADVHAGRGRAHFTLIDSFEAPPYIMPQLRVGLGDAEGQGVCCVHYDVNQRVGSYEVRGESCLSVGQVVTAAIRTQLNPADTHDKILDQLRRDPDGLMITMFGQSGWIVPDDRTGGHSIAIGGHDECSELVPSLCLVADLLRSGDLELDGEGVAKLKGHAIVAIHGAWFGNGIVGTDLTLADCYDLVDAWGRNGVMPPPATPTGVQQRELERFLAFEDQLAFLRQCPATGPVH